MTSGVRSLGDLENRIMQVVWRSAAALTVRDIVEALEPSHPVAYTTVITVIERLRVKGWVARTKQGRSFQYQATCTEDDYAAHLMGRALEDAGNRTAALLSFAGSLDPREVEELRSALDALIDGQSDRR
ncbi:MAG: BlaI/MecI/CopY family transcriptional regulator [Sporichthyaceae bacterium]